MTKQPMKKKGLVSSCFGILVIDANRYVKIATYLEIMLTAFRYRIGANSKTTFIIRC